MNSFIKNDVSIKRVLLPRCITMKYKISIIGKPFEVIETL